METPVTLLQRLRRSTDDLAWRRFVRLYTPILYAWAKRLSADPTRAEDLVQEMFVLLVEQLPHFDYNPRKSFRGWLWTLTLNKWREFQRRRPQPTADSIAVEGAIDPHEDEPFWEAEYRHHLVHRALEIMQHEFETSTWKACWETVVSGRSAKDVGLELGLTVNAVYLAKSRVLRRLHQELDGLAD